MKKIPGRIYASLLRKKLTPAEAFLWRYLQKSQLKNRKFRSQQVIGTYIVDFYCPLEKLVVELDGQDHFLQSRQDYEYHRIKILEKKGFRVLKYENKDGFDNLEAVLEDIKSHFWEMGRR